VMPPVEFPDHERIRRDLVRTVIKEPLYTEMADPEKAAVPLGVIIELNDEHYLGKTEAVAALQRLVETAARGQQPEPATVISIGTEQNPYFKSRLRPAVIRALVEADYRRALDRQGDALRKQKEAAKGATPQPTRAPAELVRYLVIRRIWLDHPLRGLIDRSVSTVKADAPRRAFLAEGRDIVWAVIDSGIDGTHFHFQPLDTLGVTLPVIHADFTSPTGDAKSALVDRFGHGTHVAGII